MRGLKAGAVFVLVCYMMLFAWLEFLDSRGITSCIQEIGSRIDTLNIERLIQNINYTDGMCLLDIFRASN